MDLLITKQMCSMAKCLFPHPRPSRPLPGPCSSSCLGCNERICDSSGQRGDPPHTAPADPSEGLSSLPACLPRAQNFLSHLPAPRVRPAARRQAGR